MQSCRYGPVCGHPVPMGPTREVTTEPKSTWTLLVLWDHLSKIPQLFEFEWIFFLISTKFYTAIKNTHERIAKTSNAYKIDREIWPITLPLILWSCVSMLPESVMLTKRRTGHVCSCRDSNIYRARTRSSLDQLLTSNFETFSFKLLLS